MVFSVLWIDIVGYGPALNVHKQYQLKRAYKGTIMMLPMVFDSQLRGTTPAEHECRNFGKRTNLCWHKEATFRRLYPEYRVLSAEVLADKLYAKAGKPLSGDNEFWQIVAILIFQVMSDSLLLLATAFIGIWIFQVRPAPRAKRMIS
jgi:hypothetical protein